MIKFNIPNDLKTKNKIYINIGALLDIPNANFLIGKRGETIINGGLGAIYALAGVGNNFKSTILHYAMLSAANRIAEATPTLLMTYDTEVNIALSRLESLAHRFPNLPDNIITGSEDEAWWTIVDKSTMTSDKWVEMLQEYSEAKAKDKKSTVVYEARIDPYLKKPLVSPTPVFVEIDSFSELEAESTEKILEKGLDDQATNTIFMRQGLYKNKLMSIMPKLSNSGGIYILLTAQLGDKINMATGPAAYSQPTKKLQYMKGDENLKAVGSKFYFLTSSLYKSHSSSALKNQGTGYAEYPIDNKSVSNASDLNVVKMTSLRNKNGPSGATIEIVVSQTEGVLPTLTEFHYIKGYNRYGFIGNLNNYQLVMYPEVNLSRTTIRTKIDSDAKLRRAINITAELLQLTIYHDAALAANDLLCTPEELYNDLVKLGYDWNIILETRGYETPNQYTNPVPYLSTVDLLKMRKGMYHPYFLKDDKTLMTYEEIKNDRRYKD